VDIAIILSVVIVNYNTPDLVNQAVRSIEDTTTLSDYEIVVVNNGGAEMTYAAANEKVTSLAAENKGFGHACNIGARAARGKYLLFLNPDTLMHNQTLDKSVAYMEQNPGIGMLGVCSRRENGAFDHGCKRGFPTPFASLCYFTGMDKLFPKSRQIGAYRQTFLPEDGINDVDSVSGAYMLIPNALFRELNGFDVSFFMYGEDLDLCYRVKQADRRVVYYGEAAITHLKGQSGLLTSSKAVVDHFYDGMVMFYNKYYQAEYGTFMAKIAMFGITTMRKRALRRLR